MTPFERAKKNIQHLVDGLIMMGLIAKTLEESRDLSETEDELVWTAILSLLETTGKMGDAN